MGSKVSMPPTPAAPPPVDYTKESLNYINAMTDPDLQARIFESEKLYAPQYADLDLANLNRFMQGSETTPGLMQITSQATIEANRLASEQLSKQRAADIGDVESLGGRASAAFYAANPQLAESMKQAESLRFGGGTQIADQIQALVSRGIDPIQAKEIAARQIGQSPLGSGLQRAGLQQLQQATGEGELNRAGLDFLSRGGALTASQQRNVVQQAREGSAARGRLSDQSSLYGEIGARLAEEMNLERQNAALGAELLSKGFGMGQTRLGTASGIYSQDIIRENANQQAALAADQANQQAALTAGQANLQSQLSQRSQGLQGLLSLGQLQQAQSQQDRAYALSLAQMRQSQASDPFQAILGRPSQSQAAGMQQVQFGAGMAGQPLGPNLFDPNAGINLGLQQNANLANYQANLYGSQASYAGATNQGRGAMIGGIFAGLGALGGGMIAKCWVARAVYGENDIRWHIFRAWLMTEAPQWFHDFYCKYGPAFAEWIKDKPAIKAGIRFLMNFIVNPRLKMEVA